MRQVRARTLPLVLLALLTGCSDSERACPAYKEFDGVFLDYRDISLRGNITGRICLEDECRTLREWQDFGGGGQGRLNLALDQERKDVRLRVELLGGGPSAPLQLDRRIDLIAVYNADRECGVYGYSRVVTINAKGQVELGDATPER